MYVLKAKPGNGHILGCTGIYMLGHMIRVLKGEGDKLVRMYV